MITPSRLIIAILNWKQEARTQECLKSVMSAEIPKHSEIVLINNESSKDELSRLQKTFPDILFIYHEKNLGFSEAYNEFFRKRIPKLQDKDLILILNNDTLVENQTFRELIKQINFENKTEMVAANSRNISDYTKVDNQGLCIYQSGLSYTKLSAKQKLFCPSGTCALYSVHLLRTVKIKTGYFFDPAYFCYNEDLDLGYRARLLNFEAAYASKAIIQHHRSLSTGGQLNTFILYHAIRNSLFSLIKNTPLLLLLLYSHYILIIQTAIFFRCLCQGELKMILKIYWETMKKLPRLLKKRHLVQKNRTLSSWKLRGLLTTGLYDSKYLKISLRTLFSKNWMRKYTGLRPFREDGISQTTSRNPNKSSI